MSDKPTLRKMRDALSACYWVPEGSLCEQYEALDGIIPELRSIADEADDYDREGWPGHKHIRDRIRRVIGETDAK